MSETFKTYIGIKQNRLIAPCLFHIGGGGGGHMKFEKCVPYYYKCCPSNLVKDGPRSFSQEKKLLREDTFQQIKSNTQYRNRPSK